MKEICFILVAGILLQSCVSNILPTISVVRSPLPIVETDQRLAGSQCLLRNVLCSVFTILPNGLRLLPRYCYSPIPEPTPTSTCPMFKCKELNCSNGQRPTFLENGCKACDECVMEPATTLEPIVDECTLEPPCPILICEELVCPYGKNSTTSPDGCAGCDVCLPKPCKKPVCSKPKCAFGTIPLVLSNGCPGCDVCRECETLECEPCTGESIKTFLENGCPGCDVCKPCDN